jgi:flagellar hook-associated protein 3 FlgL
MRVTNLIQNTQITNSIQTMQQQISMLQRQIGSGKKADRFSGLGVDARASIQLRAQVEQINAYRFNITATERRAVAMDTALRQVGDIANSIRDEILKATDGQEPDMTLLNRLARDALDQVNRLLNSSIDGRHLFSGVAIDTAPMLDPAANLAFTDGELAGYTPANVATKLTNIQAQFTTVTNYYAGDTGAQRISSLIDDGISISYDVRADDPAFQSLMAGLHIMAELDYDPTQADTATDIMLAAADFLKLGFNGVNDAVAILGSQRQLLTQASTRHDETETVLQTQVGDIEDVDVAAKITQLLALQTQLQSSFNVIGSLRSLNLAQFLG